MMIRFAKRTFSRLTPNFSFSEPKKIKLSEHESLMKEEEIKQKMPEIFSQIQDEALTLEKEVIKTHQLKLKRLRARIPGQTTEKVEKINSILQGLTLNQREYLKLALIQKIEPTRH